MIQFLQNDTYVIYVNLTGEDDYERSYHVLGKVCFIFIYHLDILCNISNIIRKI